jgi:hypothetical protein
MQAEISAMYLAIQISKPSSQISQLGRRDEVVVQILNHYASKLDILVLSALIFKLTW